MDRRSAIFAFCCLASACGSTPTPVQPTVSATPVVPAALVLAPPTPVAPSAGAVVSPRPSFTVTNPPLTEPGPLSCQFEISASATFDTIISSGTVVGGSAQTTYIPSVDLSIG